MAKMTRNTRERGELSFVNNQDSIDELQTGGQTLEECVVTDPMWALNLTHNTQSIGVAAALTLTRHADVSGNRP